MADFSTATQLFYLSDRHAILSAFRDAIEAAEQAIVLQMYLFARNGEQTLLLPRENVFPYAQTVAEWLIEKRRRCPDLPIVVVLDSNTPENGAKTRKKGTLLREVLVQHGITVLCANLFSTTFDRGRHFLNAKNFHLQHKDISKENWVETQNLWQSLHNVEDHRKNLVIDGGRLALVTSHNLFDPAWDWHENAFWLTGSVAQKLWTSALHSVKEALSLPHAVRPETPASWLHKVDAAVAPLSSDTSALLTPSFRPVSGYPHALIQGVIGSQNVHASDLHCDLCEHANIRSRVVSLLEGAEAGDEILLATAYLSDLPMLDTIESVLQKGVRVRVLVDSLSALPLPPVYRFLARNLVNYKAGIAAHRMEVRYPDRFLFRVHDSHQGAMMHLKTIARLGKSPLLLGGQANFTPHSFSGAYLETDIETRSRVMVEQFAAHFEKLWSLPETTHMVPKTRTKDLLCQVLLRLFSALGLSP